MNDTGSLTGTPFRLSDGVLVQPVGFVEGISDGGEIGVKNEWVEGLDVGWLHGLTEGRLEGCPDGTHVGSGVDFTDGWVEE